MQALKENHIWQIINSPFNAKILGDKQIYRIKRDMDGKSSWYKVKQIVKNNE